ncbi:MAG: YolD-like family protein [Acholeplasmataceae bacterium]|nr:YolD-like family protein [Acholeplasmataceae bacterium]
MPEYVDRGLIKWAPFDALVGYNELIKELRLKLGKQEKPLLSDDQFEELNRQLAFAYHHHLEITIEYYQNGYFKHLFGHIKTIDPINKKIILTSSEKINCDDVVHLSL